MIGQLLNDSIGKSDVHGTFKIKFLKFLRAIWIKFHNPLIQLNLWGYKFKAHLSHELPMLMKSYPGYNQNISRISTVIQSKYNDLCAIDVGANIGDTVAILRRDSTFPILCVEGDPKYFDLLVLNVKQFSEVYFENSYLGKENLSVAGKNEHHHGTNMLVISDEKSDQINIKALDSILSSYPQFLNSKFFKIDTDGFDFEVLKGSSNLIKTSSPVIFFEYEPRFLNKNGEDSMSIFSYLENFGYNKLIFFDSSGDMLVSADMSDKNTITELKNFLSVKDTGRYVDICAFTFDDNDLFNKIILNESEYLKKHSI